MHFCFDCAVFAKNTTKNSKNSHFYVLVYSTGLAALAVTANATQRILYEFYGSNHDQTKPYFVFYLRIMMMMINTSTHWRHSVSNFKIRFDPFFRNDSFGYLFNQQNVHFLFRLLVGIVCNLSRRISALSLSILIYSQCLSLFNDKPQWNSELNQIGRPTNQQTNRWCDK